MQPLGDRETFDLGYPCMTDGSGRCIPMNGSMYGRIDPKRPIGYTDGHGRFVPMLSARVGQLQDSTNPQVFGPPMWVSYHIMSANYPVAPTAEVQKLMTCRVKAIPIEVPCAKCKDHAQDFISRNNIELACKSRENLFIFFVNFHNAVNKRLGKPIMPLEDAKRIYGYKQS